jgi:hypothetical protein
MRSYVLVGVGLVLLLGLAILATTWHSWVSWDFAISIQPISRAGKAIVLGVLMVAVVVVWRGAGSRSA